MGFFAHGTTISLGGTAIGGVTNIDGPGLTKDIIDLTDHDSGGDEEITPGLRRGDTVTLEGNLASGVAGDTGQDALRTNYDADGAAAIEEVIVTFPDNAGATATTLTFDAAVVRAPSPSFPYDDKATFTAELRVDGAVTWAKATAA